MISRQYLAGFIDGEGYLALGRIPRRNWSVEYPVRLVVYNTNGGILEEIRQTWGGTMSFSRSPNPRWKPQYALIWTNAAAARILTEVAPFLRLKSEQAAVLLDYHSRIRRGQRVRDRRGRLLSLPGKEVRFREALYQRLKCLNATGAKSEVARNHLPASRGGRRGADGPVSSEYLAGFVDGEGSLMIAKWKGRESWNPQYRARISVSNTDRRVLDDIHAAFGGIMADQPPARTEWRHAYQLIWTGGMIAGLLSSVAPHLRLKQPQAAVMREFIRHQERTRQGRRGLNGRFFAPLPAEVIAHREALYQRMRGLNARGSPGLIWGANLNP